MIIDITPIVAVFFNLIMILLGIDYIWCGYWYMRTHKIKFTIGLFGYLTLKLLERYNRKNKSSNQFANSMFSMEAAGKYMVVGGIGIVITSIFPLLTANFR